MLKAKKTMEHLMNLYPLGMLDRDQRTILTVLNDNNLKKYNLNNNIKDNFIYMNLNKSNKSDNNNNNNNNLINNNNNINKFILMQKFNYKEKSTKIYTKLKLKSLLTCIVFLILFLPLTYASPLHRRRMEDSSNHGDNIDFNKITNENNKKCQLLNNVLTIAVNGYHTILNEINDYTKKTSGLDHLVHHQEWIRRHNDALYPKKGGELKFCNYDVPPPAQFVQHLYRTDINLEQKSVEELLNIYERFKLILNGMQEIIKAKEADGNFNVEHGPTVMNFFKKQEETLRELLQEIEMGLKTLRIDIPEINNNNIEYKNDGFDWITMREYLKLLVYTIKAFNILVEHCQQDI